MPLPFRLHILNEPSPDAGSAPARIRTHEVHDPATQTRANRPSCTVGAPPLTPTIFHEPWWLEIAGDGAVREVTVSTGGQIVGRLPYLVSRPVPGLTRLGSPAMAHVLGPAIQAPPAPGAFPGPCRQVSITRDLIAQLPKASHTSFRLHGGITNTLAFDAAGFVNSVGYTVEIAPAPAEILWRGMRDKTRNLIRRAQEVLVIEELADPDAFMAFYEANLEARGRRSFYDRRICTRLIAACGKRGAGRMLAARDRAGRMHSAILTVWDRVSEYYFMSTRTPESHNGANSLMVWTAIQHAARNGLIFDMDGLHVTNHRVSNFWLCAGFGGVIRPRYIVRRSSLLVEAGRRALELLPRS
jgi:hypothetical protein